MSHGRLTDQHKSHLSQKGCLSVNFPVFSVSEAGRVQRLSIKASKYDISRCELGDQTFCGLSKNLFARAVTKRIQTCHRRLDWFHTFITQMNSVNIVMWGNTDQHCRLGFFHDWDLTDDLDDSKSTSGCFWFVFGSRIFVPIRFGYARNYVCIPQFYRNTNHFVGCWTVHGWTTCSRPWDVVIEVLISTNNTARQNNLAQGDLCGTKDHSINETKDPRTNWKKKARGWAIVKCG